MFKKIVKRPYYYFFTSLFIIITVFIILYIIGYRYIQKQPSEYNWLERQTAAISQSSIIKPTFIISDFFNILKFSFIADGTKIRDLSLNYEQLKNEFLLLQYENKRLSGIVNYHPVLKNIVATARVISDINSLGSGIFIISAGAQQGIKFGDVVTTTEGLVGKIVKIHSDTAIVLPVRHLSAKTIGRIKSQGSMVLISGRHLKGGIIDYVSDTINLEKGQEIYTISDGKSMPSGIKIGTLIDPYERPIRVKLAIDFSKLDYVTVVRKVKKDKNLPTVKTK